MLKHRAVTQSRAADAETQRKPPGPTMLKHKGSRYSQRSTKHQPSLLHKNADTVKSAIHVAETAHELRC
jgi:hypothetical protein